MLSLARTVLSFSVSRLLSHTVGVHHGDAHAQAGPRRIGRRNFVRNAALGAVGVNLAVLGGLFPRWLWPNKTGDFGKELRVAQSNVPETGGEPFVYAAGKFYLVHTDTGVMALYWKCPHLGCTVPPFDEGTQSFNCGCHGSIYAYDGEYLGGPAPRGLDFMAVSLDEATGDVLVDTGNIIERGTVPPSPLAI